MNRFRFFLMIAASGLACQAQAELYKWTGPDGKIVYSDQPPPASVAAEKKPVAAAATSVALPYELAQAAGNHPVVLYTTSACAPCDAARKLLNERGVPFAEKTVTTADDATRLNKAVGASDQLPVMTVGRATQLGFEPSAWSTALTAAGYPQTSRLPRSYRNPAPEPAAPLPAVVAKKEAPGIADKPAPAVTGASPAALDSPSKPAASTGFRF